MARPTALALSTLESKYPHFLVADTGVFNTGRDSKTKADNNPQLIVTDVGMELGEPPAMNLPPFVHPPRAGPHPEHPKLS